MAFAVVGSNSSGQFGDSTTHSPSLPAGIVAGDLLIGLFDCDSDTTLDITTPAAGWTSISNTVSSTLVRFRCYYRIADGGEGGTITITLAVSNALSYIIYRITAASWHGSTVPEAGTAVPANTSTPNPPVVRKSVV